MSQDCKLEVPPEEKIKNMGNAGRNGGEYYTPRPLIKSIIKVINPKIGETIYDGAVGSAGFLAEAYEHIKQSKSLTNRLSKNGHPVGICKNLSNHGKSCTNNGNLGITRNCYEFRSIFCIFSECMFTVPF